MIRGKKVVVLGAMILGLVAAGMVTYVGSATPSLACVKCDAGGCTCPEVLGDGALSCEIHSKTKLRFGWLSWATGLGIETECDCTPIGECHRAPKLTPKIKG